MRKLFLIVLILCTSCTNYIQIPSKVPVDFILQNAFDNTEQITLNKIRISKTDIFDFPFSALRICAYEGGNFYYKDNFSIYQNNHRQILKAEVDLNNDFASSCSCTGSAGQILFTGKGKFENNSLIHEITF